MDHHPVEEAVELPPHLLARSLVRIRHRIEQLHRQLDHEARLIATVLYLPLDPPVIEFDRDSEDTTWKLPDVRRFVGDRPVAWIDDDLWEDAFEWAEERSSATLLIRVAPHRALPEHTLSASRTSDVNLGAPFTAIPNEPRPPGRA